MATVTTPIAASTPSPLRTAQLARDRGVDRTTSSRRRPSSPAQPARNDAPARPMMNEPKLKNVSWRSADGWVQIDARIDRLDERLRAWGPTRSSPRRRRPRRRSSAPYSPTPMPHASAIADPIGQLPA